MALDALKGRTLGTERLRIEHGPVQKFAVAVKDDPAAYEADDAGVPATFPFAFPYWSTRGEGGAAGLPVDELRGPGRLILHGTQAFTYHRWPRVGDELVGTTTCTDVYEKDTGSAVMEFYVTETDWRDAATHEPVVTTEFTMIVRVTTT